MFLRSKKKKSITDGELVSSYRNSHDKSYVGELFQRYTHLVFTVSMKYLKNEDDSKDAVMEIFEKIMVDLKRHEVQNFKGWLHSVTKNYCLMKLRKHQTERTRMEDFQKSDIPVMEINDHEHLDNEENKQKMTETLHEGISSLRAEQRKCVELFYLQDRCYKDVAEMTGYSLKQVKSHIQNGKRNLMIYLSDNHE